MVMDFNQKRFLMMGQGVELKGLHSPVEISLAFGDYTGVGWYSGGVPWQLLEGRDDVLTVHSVSKTGDSTMILGSIAAENTHVDLSEQELTIRWSDDQNTSVTIHAGQLRKIGDTYMYSDPGSPVKLASFNLDNRTFLLIISDVAEGSNGELTVKFGSFAATATDSF